MRIPGSYRFLREIWTLGIVPQSLDDIVARGIVTAVDWLPPRRKGFLADPFGMVLPDGRGLILAEALDYGLGARCGKGTLVQTRLAGTATGAATWHGARFSPLADLGVHLSYPQVVATPDGPLRFCESWEAGAITLFDAKGPGGAWRPAGRMLDGIPAIDPTMVEHGGQWYLFLTRMDDAPLERLHLFTAPDPRGPWRAHPQTPVRHDRGAARPAGPVHRGRDGQLYRPAQDCRARYGAAVVIHRIDELTPTTFRETAVRRLDPVAPWAEGLHTVCALGDVTLIDGKRETWSLSESLERVLRRTREARRRETGRN